MNREKARLHSLYEEKIKHDLMTQLALKNIMQVPRLEKVVLNVGVKDAVGDSKVIAGVKDTIAKITGQAPVRTLARKSIAGFKLREGMPIGVMVTLRGRAMYEFLDKLINLSLPKVRDFQGVGRKFDGRGNYNLGVKEWIIFPEIDYGATEKIHGMNITIHTSARTDEQGFKLLEQFGMPFRKQ
ncbi:50S ribosomal protein L5 [Vermiphilus pyriformis]|jgi:large subunit ribosomal protein L5|uniref:Large ribosomal subunit protein uL5 n=1 Tax=candidate division TM6 bacterium JCVI TM6SC1 TaxID=1306947 RepID=A0A0D2K4Z6_9BACT|nr:50S ribosomal protein L5 [candidate division TM6 bacterium JCVI TM6SC1]UNE35375.1 MAG: 50S ribosomal protein L5 [Vermiphilus pyriformis]